MLPAQITKAARDPYRKNFIKIEEEVHCVGAGLVPARTTGDCGPQGGHKGRPYEGERLSFNLVDALR